MASEFLNILTIISLILIIFTLIFLIYRKFSKNDYDNSNYNNKIYSQPPTNDSPALINSLFGNGINKKVGEINIDAFYLTLLDLIYRNYISVKIITKKNEAKSEAKSEIKSDLKRKRVLNKLILTINNHSTDKLHSFEKNILKCINSLESKGNIDIININESINKRLKVNTFQKNYDAWMKNFHDEFFNSGDIKYFDNTHVETLKIYGVILIALFCFTSIFSYLETSYLNLIVSLCIGILGFYLVLIPYKKLGKWTKEGKELKIKYKLFKKYYNKYYNKQLKSSNKSQNLDEGINYIPYLLAMGISKSSLLKNFSQSNDNRSNNSENAYLFLKYGTNSLIRNIVKEFLAADGSFDPKYYNTSGNFVPGYGP